MATAEATREFSAGIKELGDKLANLKLLEAKELSDYLEEAYGFKPAAGGVVMAPGGMPGGGEAAPAEEQTEFDVILKDYPDAAKVKVIKVVRAATQLGLKEAKDLVESKPKPVKEGISKEDAEKLKKELEAEGATVEVK